MVRQWVLVPPFGGSNPSSPARLCCFCGASQIIPDYRGVFCVLKQYWFNVLYIGGSLIIAVRVKCVQATSDATF